jgi:hypothetical protein
VRACLSSQVAEVARASGSPRAAPSPKPAVVARLEAYMSKKRMNSEALAAKLAAKMAVAAGRQSEHVSAVCGGGAALRVICCCCCCCCCCVRAYVCVCLCSCVCMCMCACTCVCDGGRE